MHLGMPLAEYDAAVGPKNKRFHEVAETIRLAKEGVVPIEDDPTDGYDVDAIDTDTDPDDPVQPRSHGHHGG